MIDHYHGLQEQLLSFRRVALLARPAVLFERP